MNAMLNINIRVTAAQARQQIASVGTAIASAQAMANKGGITGMVNKFGLGGTAAAGFAGKVDKLGAKIGSVLGSFPKWNKHIEGMGKNLQWVGRQLEFNFTLPLATAGFFATKWALDNEKAMVQVKKVYGDLSFTQERVNSETDALSKSFEMLSTRFGVAQSDVINIGAAFASAGSAGRGLAEDTRAALEAMIIGDMSAEDATQALISIISIYHLSTKKGVDGTSELTNALADMNIIENQTAVRFRDLLDVVQRSGGVAVEAGIDLRHLAAMASALIPATGGAAQAGNALRTIISRLMAPTKDSIEVLGLMGINIYDATWQAANGTERIEMLAKSFEGLTQSQKGVAASVIASRWQVSRFDVLMADINSTTGFYARSLDATSGSIDEQSNKTEALAAYYRELSTVLDSNPKKFDILKTSIQNSLAHAILPLIPAIASVMAMFSKWAQAFSEMDPHTQRMIIFGLAFVAIMGPVVRLLGASILLLSQLGKMFFFVGKGSFWLARQMYQLAYTMVTSLLLPPGTVAKAWSSSATSQIKSAALAAQAQTAAAGAAGAAGAGAAGASSSSWVGAAYASRTAWVMFADSFGLAAGSTAIAAIGAAATTRHAWTTTFNTLALGAGRTTLALGAGFVAFGELMAGVAASTGETWIATNAFVIQTHQITAGAVETVWVGALGAIVAANAAATEAVGGMWIATAEGIVAAMTAAMAWVATTEGIVVPASFMAAGAVATAWELEATTSATTHALSRVEMASTELAVPAAALEAAGMTGAFWASEALQTSAIEVTSREVMAASQALVPAAAAPAAAATAGFWVRAGAVMKAAIVQPILFAARFLATAVLGILTPVAAALGIPVWALVALIAAAVAIIVLILKTDLGDKIWEIIKSIGSALASLPGIFSSVLQAVIRVVVRAVEIIWDALSYLNPFAKHSPSLVDQVRAGVATILDQYAKLRRIGPMLLAAAKAHDDFNRAIASSQGGFDATKRGEQRQAVAEVAPQVDALKSVLPDLAAEISAQGVVVAQWQAKLDVVDAVLERHKAILADLEYQLDSLGSAISDAKSKMDDLGNTDLPGMREMSDRIFENEQAQKRLRLEIMRMEDAGGSIDELNDKYAALSGWIELLQGEQQDLRLAGAGSDILSVYDEQIAALESQRDSLNGQADDLQRLNDELEQLQRQGEEMTLQESLDFDGPLRQIDQMITGLHEMPFDEIVAGIQAQQDIIAQLQPQYDALAVKVEQERLATEGVQRQRDAINNSLQTESDRLSDLNSAYSDINGLITEMEQGINSFTSDAKASSDALKDLFDAAAAGDFDVPTGTGILGPEGGLADIEAFNAELQKELEDVMGNMDAFDPFGPIKDKFYGFIDWLKSNAPTIGLVLVGGIIGFLIGGPPGALIGAALGGLLAKTGKSILKGLASAFGWAVKTFGPILSVIFNILLTVWDVLWNTMGTVAGFVWNSILKPIFDAMVWVFQSILVPVMSALAAIVIWAWETVIAPVISFAWGIIQPILMAMWGIFTGYIMPVFQLFAAIVEIVVVLVARLIGWLWTNVLYPIFTNLGGIIGVVGGIFVWLWKSIIIPVFGAIAAILVWTWNTILHPIFDAIKNVVQTVLGPVFTWLWQNVIAPAWGAISSIIQWGWDNVLWPIFKGIKWAIENVVAPVFSWLKDSVIAPVWDGIQAIIAGVWNTIAGILEGGVNFFIKIFNALARAVNTIGGALSIDVNVSEMDEIHIPRIGGGGGPGDGGGGGGNGVKHYAHGGTIPFIPYDQIMGKFNMPTAIVGEGSSAWPEYVIPTDPRHRGNALRLYADLGGKLADVGDVISGGADIVGGAAGFTKDAVLGGASAVKAFWDAVNEARHFLTDTSVRLMHDVGEWTVDSVVEWGTEMIKRIPGAGLLFDGIGTVTDIGTSIVGGAVDVGGDIVGGVTSLGGLLERGGVLGLASGGGFVVPRTPGGVLMRVAEGRNDERVQVTPLRGGGDGEKHYHFYGDLEFPNIKSGDDAEKFIRNLETLVGD
jgi:TP901 family phage tail tape measure protein